jgi:hypothetical protein
VRINAAGAKDIQRVKYLQAYRDFFTTEWGGGLGWVEVNLQTKINFQGWIFLELKRNWKLTNANNLEICLNIFLDQDLQGAF